MRAHYEWRIPVEPVCCGIAHCAASTASATPSSAAGTTAASCGRVATRESVRRADVALDVGAPPRSHVEARDATILRLSVERVLIFHVAVRLETVATSN